MNILFIIIPAIFLLLVIGCFVYNKYKQKKMKKLMDQAKHTQQQILSDHRNMMLTMMNQYNGNNIQPSITTMYANSV